MLKLFKKVTVEEIHNAFDTADDRLLQEALSIINEGALEKGGRLERQGFTSSKEVALVSGMKMKKEEAQLIQYYKQKYPFNKFLTESELDRICNKYGLIHAPVSAYTQVVPEKNLREIESAPNLLLQDEPKEKIWSELRLTNWLFPNGDFLSFWNPVFWKLPTVVQGVRFRSQFDADDYLRAQYGTDITYLVERVRNYQENKNGLFIAAPASHFNLKGLKKSGLFGFTAPKFLEVTDPIVFRYVNGGIQVISKWGDEAN